jgi:hypothetical protein
LGQGERERNDERGLSSFFVDLGLGRRYGERQSGNLLFWEQTIVDPTSSSRSNFHAFLTFRAGDKWTFSSRLAPEVNPFPMSS